MNRAAEIARTAGRLSKLGDILRPKRQFGTWNTVFHLYLILLAALLLSRPKTGVAGWQQQTDPGFENDRREGVHLYQDGWYEEAQARLKEALACAKASNDRDSERLVLTNLGKVLLRTGPDPAYAPTAPPLRRQWAI